MEVKLSELFEKCGTRFCIESGQRCYIDRAGYLIPLTTDGAGSSRAVPPDTLVTPLYLTETPTAPKWRFFTYPGLGYAHRSNGVTRESWCADHFGGEVRDGFDYVASGWTEITEAQALALTTGKPKPPPAKEPKWRFFTIPLPDGEDVQRTRGDDPIENDLWSASTGWMPSVAPWLAAKFLLFGWIEITEARALALTTGKPVEPPAKENDNASHTD